jgi:hypothetical protein
MNIQTRSALMLVGLLGLAAVTGYTNREREPAQPEASTIPLTVRLDEVVAFEGDPDSPTRVTFPVNGVMGTADVWKVSNGVAYVRGWRPMVRTVRGTAGSQG